MKVWITRDWSDKQYEIWKIKPTKWSKEDNYYKNGTMVFSFEEFFSDKECDGINDLDYKLIKKLFKLDKHLKKKEIIEATMTFKIKK